VDPQLLKYGFEMTFHGIGGDDQRLGNLFVGEPLSHQFEHFPLPFGQVDKYLLGFGGISGFIHRVKKRVAVEGLLLKAGENPALRVSAFNVAMPLTMMVGIPSVWVLASS
jgi:hypothetical protein